MVLEDPLLCKAVTTAIDMVVILRAPISMGLVTEALPAVELKILFWLTVRHGTPPLLAASFPVFAPNSTREDS